MISEWNMSLDLSSSFHQFRISMAEGSKNGTLAFDSFTLDVANLMLYRDGKEILIAPKIAKTLSVLVENSGNIISKDQLIEKVWDDSIVEEANLTQYLYILRKTLGVMPDGRPYIETLRRRGYRFNGEVRQLTADKSTTFAPRPQTEKPAAAFAGNNVEREGNVLRVVDWQTPESLTEQREPEPADPSLVIAAHPISLRRSGVLRFAVAATALLLLGAGGTFLWPRLMPAATVAESRREISVVRLTNGPLPAAATISLDGNVFAYSELDGETSRMYVQQTGQTTRIEIASAPDKVFATKTFSPDGQSIYYVALDKKTSGTSLYRIPTMGGASVKVLENINGPVAFSPDGKEFAFCRLNSVTGETAVVIAGSDGHAERVLLQRKSPKTLLDSVSWSPDGKLIAFGEQNIEESRAYTLSRLYVVEVATGTVNPVSEEDWDNILRMFWMPDGTGLVINATRENEGYSTRRDQIYFVSYPGGVSERLTSDGNRYEPGSLGITRKGEILAVPSNRSAQVWLMNADGNSTSATQLTRGAADGRAGLGPLPDGKFGYLARTGDEISVMLANADASETKQIPTGFQFVEELRADPLGRFFVFSTSRDRKSYLYRIDSDGENLKQLTFGERAVDSTISPDGKFLVYDYGQFEGNKENFSLMRVPTDGGDPVVLKQKGCFIPMYSPDGSLISCIDNEKLSILIVSARDGSEIERHTLPVFSAWNFGIGWTPDGTGLIYILTEKGTSNLWIQPRDGSKPHRLTNFSSGVIYRYAFSPDGSKLFVARGYPTQDAVLIRNFR
jgi:Tol biopolymer transport system component/DNA-binding winged helix-turn-helix (wHTH) protein